MTNYIQCSTIMSLIMTNHIQCSKNLNYIFTTKNSYLTILLLFPSVLFKILNFRLLFILLFFSLLTFAFHFYFWPFSVFMIMNYWNPPQNGGRKKSSLTFNVLICNCLLFKLPVYIYYVLFNNFTIVKAYLECVVRFNFDFYACTYTFKFHIFKVECLIHKF